MKKHALHRLQFTKGQSMIVLQILGNHYISRDLWTQHAFQIFIQNV